MMISHALWNPQNLWDGSLNIWEWGFVSINLIILSIAAAELVRRQGWVAALPGLILLAYHLSNALARSSGSRYVVPVDWALLIYYLVGFLLVGSFLGVIPMTREAIFQPAQGPEEIPSRKTNRSSIIMLIGFTIYQLRILRDLKFRAGGEEGNEE